MGALGRLAWWVLGLAIAAAARSRSISIPLPLGTGAGADYYDQFDLDYGCSDNVRGAGALRGFVKSGVLSKLPQSDLFIKWVNEYVEKGPEPITDRLKPFYAADFGTKADLKKGEHPKVIIVNRRLSEDMATGHLAAPPTNIDVEVRSIWQPWLRRKCNFAVRYLVPHRPSLCRIMATKKRFRAELQVDKDARPTAQVRMVFRPSWLERLVGRRDTVITYPVDASKLV